MKFTQLLLVAAVAIAAPVPNDDAAAVANADAANAVPLPATAQAQPVSGESQTAPAASTDKPSGDEIRQAANAVGVQLSDDQVNNIAAAYEQSPEAGDQAVAAAQGAVLPDAANGVFTLPGNHYYWLGGRRYRYHGFQTGFGWKWGWGLNPGWGGSWGGSWGWGPNWGWNRPTWGWNYWW